MENIKRDGLDTIIKDSYSGKNGDLVNKFPEPKKFDADTGKGKSIASKKYTQIKKHCHYQFTTVGEAHEVLLDENGRFIPTTDICKVCREPFTIEQKISLLKILMEKQKFSDVGYFNGSFKKNIYLQNTSQGKAI